MIKELSLKGFKSFLDDNIYFAPLTVLTGLNSSGKSSVMQALRIIGNVSVGRSNPLIEGHGTVRELQNNFMKERFSISVVYTNQSDEEVALSYSPGIVSQADNSFPELIYVSADRYGPRTLIPITSSHQLGERGDNVLNCIEYYRDYNLDDLLRHEDSQGFSFQHNLMAWLGAVSPGVKFEWKVQEEMDASFSLFNGHRAKNVGFGLSYTLPIIVALFLGTINKESVVLLENPEAHLHPKGQTELARLISLAVEAGAQVVVETHSDHLFDGIRIYARKHKGFAEKVQTYWFELDNNSLTQTEAPTMLDNGDLDQWPKGMFDQFGVNASELLK